jgi:ParB family chromosome partitioning protein
MSRQALGRGLSALLGDEPAERAGAAEFIELDLDLLESNSEQPRQRFSDAELEELAQSIRANGVVQPILVRKIKNSYQIVAGERRWRAAQRAELKKIPAVVRDVSDDKMLEIALIENIQRQELNPVEEARAYQKLIDNFGLTQEKVADRVGKTRPFVANYLRLLKLPSYILKYLETGELSVGHARALLAVTGNPSLLDLVKRVLTKPMSVRETEIAVRRMKEGKRSSPEPKRASETDPNIKRAETRLRRRFGTQVRIVSPSGVGKGKIEIEYYGEADLDRIYNLLMGKEDN